MRTCAIRITAAILFFSGLVSAQADRFTIYLSPPMRDGFVDTTTGVQDSIKDIRSRLQSMKQIRVVDRKESADIVLTIVKRGVGSETFGQRLTYSEPFGAAELSLTPIETTTIWVSTVMEVGNYRKEIVGTDSGIYAAWGACAKQIAKDLEAWVKANANQLKQRASTRIK